MRSTCLVLMLIAYSSVGFCQKTDTIEVEQPWPFMIAFSAQSYSWPIVKSFGTPIQPGFKMGTEYVYSAKKNHTILQTLTIGYFHRRHTREVFKAIDNGDFESKTDWGSPGVQVSLKLGAG